jgi:hypothetical protein
MLARADSEDPSMSVTAILPDAVVCQEHADALAARNVQLGWCDDERCRLYGESGKGSPCGEPFKELKR